MLVVVIYASANGFAIFPTYRLTGSSVPDLIVSMSNQMWLHLQSDDSIGSPGFKAVYQGTNSINCYKHILYSLHLNKCISNRHLALSQILSFGNVSIVN